MLRRAALVLALWPTVGSAEPPAPLACPADTHARSTSKNDRTEEWCERSDKTRHGPFRSFSGAVLTGEGRYVDGKEDGRWMGWHDDGTPFEERHYDRGILHGEQIVWNRGVVEMRSSYRHGKEHGTWVWRHGNDREKAITTYVDGRKQGRATEWDESGEVISDGKYDRDTRVGRWIERADGYLERGMYCAGQRCGHWEVFEDESLFAAGEYRAGLRENLWITWQGTRRVSRAMYARGQKHGRFERWDYETGRKITEIECRRGMPHGLRREWWTDGKLRLAGHYDEGELDGMWTTCEDGKTTERAVYDHGSHVSGGLVEPSASGFEADGAGGVHECEFDILHWDGLPANH